MALSMVGPEQLRRILEPMLSEQEFLSPHGLRSVSRHHRAAPFVLDLPELHASVDYDFGDDFVVEHPTGSGVKRTLAEWPPT